MSDPCGCDLVVELHLPVMVVEFPYNPLFAVDFPAHVTVNNYGDVINENVTAVVQPYEAGENVNVNRVVALQPDGRIVHADKDEPLEYGDVVGVTRQSGATGAMVEVVTFGRLTGAALGVIGDNLFLGSNGLVTAVAPNTGMWLSVGVQTAATEFFVNIGEPIET